MRKFPDGNTLEDRIAENMHSQLLGALRQREQDILKFITILAPALGGFVYLVIKKRGADPIPDDVFLYGVLGVLLVLEAGSWYASALSYNFRSITLQMIKIELDSGMSDHVLSGWPRDFRVLRSSYTLWKRIPWCPVPEVILVFWMVFLISAVFAICLSWFLLVSERDAILLWIGIPLVSSSILWPIYYGCKLRKICALEIHGGNRLKCKDEPPKSSNSTDATGEPSVKSE